MGVAIAVLGGLVQIAIPIAVIVFFIRRRRGRNADVDLGLAVRRPVKRRVPWRWYSNANAKGKRDELPTRGQVSGDKQWVFDTEIRGI